MKKSHLVLGIIAGVIAGIVLGLSVRYVPPGYKYVQHQNEMVVDSLDTEKVTLADIAKHPFTLVIKKQTGNNVFFWQLRSGHMVINFEHVPDNIFFKWNEGEVVDPRVIQRVLEIDGQIKSNQWNNHIQQQ